MATVLVTGGTGTLGRRVVPRLVAAGHAVRVLSRRAAATVPEGVSRCQGDVLTGAGVDAAVAGTDVVIHAASNPRRHVRDTEVEGARHVSRAARHAGAHVIYVSIVGVDRHRYPYYRAKLAAEQVVASSGAGWTVQRATQFHDLLEFFMSKGVFVRTPHLAFQVVDAGEVADRLVELAAGEPQGIAPDFGGPEIVPMRELADTRADITGRRTRLLPVPRIGWIGDFDRGRHLAPEHRSGTVTWAEWLRSRGAQG